MFGLRVIPNPSCIHHSRIVCTIVGPLVCEGMPALTDADLCILDPNFLEKLLP